MTVREKQLTITFALLYSSIVFAEITPGVILCSFMESESIFLGRMKSSQIWHNSDIKEL